MIHFKVGDRVAVSNYKDWQEHELLLYTGMDYKTGKIKVFNVNKKKSAVFFSSRVKRYKKK